MEMVLCFPPDEKTREQLLELGFEEQDCNNASGLVVTFFEKAKEGDIRAFKAVQELIEETENKKQVENRETDLISESIQEISEIEIREIAEIENAN